MIEEYKYDSFLGHSIVAKPFAAFMVVAFMALYMAPLSALAGASNYAITGSGNVNGFVVDLSGVASANPFTGQPHHQFISIDWNEDAGALPSTSNGDWEQVADHTDLNFTDESVNGSFADSAWSGSHSYKDVGMGDYKIFVRVHHNQPAGNESESSTFNFTVFVAPQCYDEADNDDDGFVDYPADPGCAAFQQETYLVNAAGWDLPLLGQEG